MASGTDHAAYEQERAITRVLLRYCELLDTGETHRITAEVYADDAVADYNFEVMTGREAIHDFLVLNMAHFSETAHALTNVEVKSCDGQRAVVRSMMTAWHWIEQSEAERTGAPASFAQIVVCEDRLELRPEGWRVTEHRARALGPSTALHAGSAVLRRCGDD